MKKINLFLILLFFVNFVYAEDMYNMTAMDNANNIYEYILALDSTLDMGFENPIGISIILIVFSISFIITSSKTGNIIQGMLAGSFISAIIGMILLPINLLNYGIYMVILLIAAMSVFVAFLLNR